ncbi:MAG: ATP-dependent RNA helicase HrpA [Phycisphaeraceae bacterium]|nr:MAG: ATP-dependent RNA helicase HrpA [Phycisphaeraceae bacterium]
MLPIDARAGEIAGLLRGHRVVVVTGATGSGKSTRLPGIVLGSGVLGPGLRIAHTQPRRLAARSVASRIAWEMGESVGGRVGSKVRFEDRTGPSTVVKVVTDGMLLAEASADPGLGEYGVVIVDEAHERSANIDVLLGLLRGLVGRRKDLRVVVTSATIDPWRFSAYFGGPGAAPVVEVEGRTFPVEVRYEPRRVREDDPSEGLAGSVASAVEGLEREGRAGDVLVFVPGEREVWSCVEEVRRRCRGREALPLYSRLSAAEQDRVFREGGGDRVIVSTNVAETSVTVPGVRHVVDSGLERLSRYDAERRVRTLPVGWVSRASAGQRLGRCGRVGPGVCVRLYEEGAMSGWPAFTEPEVLRSGLAGVMLMMMTLGLGEDAGVVERFGWMESPGAGMVREGYGTLFELGAIDAAGAGGRLTAVGRALSRVPLDVRVGRIVLASGAEGCVREGCVLAGALSVADPRERPAGRQEEAERAQEVFRHESSDFLTLLNIWDQYEHACAGAGSSGWGARAAWCREKFLSAARMREWGEVVAQVREAARGLGLREREGPACEDAVHRAVMAGLIGHLACREDGGSGLKGRYEYRGMNGNVVSLWPGSVLFSRPPRWIVSAEVVRTTKVYARTVARVEAGWVEALAGHVLERSRGEAHLDPETGEPSVWERVSMSGVVVVPRRRVALAGVDPARARALFIEGALVEGRWKGAGGYVGAVRAAVARAEAVGARVRKRGVVRGGRELAAWFERALPAGVVDPSTLAEWRAGVSDPSEGVPGLEDLLTAEAREGLNGARYPGELEVGEGVVAGVGYAFAPGREDDGVTATVSAADLPAVDERRCAWLVPGMLGEVVRAVIKGLPKAERARVESAGGLEEVASSCAAVMTFGEGDLLGALGEALRVVHGVEVPASALGASWRGIPEYLRLRVVVLGEGGGEIGSGRDVAALKARFEATSRAASAARARARHDRDGITAWDFGTLPDVGRPVEGTDRYAALVDRGDRCALTLVGSAGEASALTALGVRRLFALACREQAVAEVRGLPGFSAMAGQYGPMGSAERLAGEIACVSAGVAFMGGAPGGGALAGTRGEFESALEAGWGRLSGAVREVGAVVGRVLEARHAVARRLSGGTNRHWAASVADLREQSAYLMPAGFLAVLPWERLREYPRYAEGMRARLMALREDGSGAERALLAEYLPRWKVFTGWVASAMARERERGEEAPAVRAGGKGALPASRRAAPVVNADAGAWAMAPGRLPAGVWSWRWLLEEARLTLFAPALGRGVSQARVDAAWGEVGRSA